MGEICERLGRTKGAVQLRYYGKRLVACVLLNAKGNTLRTKIGDVEFTRGAFVVICSGCGMPKIELLERRKPCTECYETAANAEADDDANLICSIPIPPSKVPYHVGYISRSVYCFYNSTYCAGLLRDLVFIFQWHEYDQSLSP